MSLKWKFILEADTEQKFGYKRETPSTMTQWKINKEMKGQLIIET